MRRRVMHSVHQFRRETADAADHDADRAERCRLGRPQGTPVMLEAEATTIATHSAVEANS